MTKEKFLVLIVLIFTLIFSDDFDQSHTLLNEILSKYVVDGRVNYSRLKNEQSSLNLYLSNMGNVAREEFDSWSKDQQLAYLINLYNSATIKLIIDHYPITSIKKIGSLITSPWDIKFVDLFGKKVSLNFIEHKVIRKNYMEPRVHMALVCAAIGCPPLRNEAYTANSLDNQLSDQSRKYLKSSAGTVVDKSGNVVKISKIFKWYGSDFSSVEKFILQYLPSNISINSFSYIDYNWKLNDHVE